MCVFAYACVYLCMHMSVCLSDYLQVVCEYNHSWRSKIIISYISSIALPQIEREEGGR